MKRKFLALLLAVCVSTGSLPIAAAAADRTESAGKEGETNPAGKEGTAGEGTIGEGTEGEGKGDQTDPVEDDKKKESVEMSEAAIEGLVYYWINTDEIEDAEETSYKAGEEEKTLAELTRIADTDVYYLPAEEVDLSSLVYYGTTALSYTDYYAKDTSLEAYDAVSSATTSKYSIFPHEDITTPTSEGYQILGVKNVPVAVGADIYAEAKLLEEAGLLPESGVYAKAAAITLNEAASDAVQQYKTLLEDGTYAATTLKVADTVRDAKLSLKTTTVWGDYELDVTEVSTRYIRNSRDDAFAVNSKIQGVILEAVDEQGDVTKIGMRYMEEIWVQPYEIAFRLNSAAAKNLIGKTVNKITYIMPTESYVFDFGQNGAYIKPQMGAENRFTAAFAKDAKTVAVDLSNLPADIKNPKVTVYYKAGRKTTYYVQDAEIVNGAVTLEENVLPNLTYTVVVSSDNYADKAVSADSLPGDIAGAKVSLSQSSYAYDGTAKKPAVTIDGLTENTDYTIAYANNVNAGTAEVQIKGMGNYTGTQTVKFTIEAKTIPASAVSNIGAVTYNGSAQCPAVTVTGLKAGVDYEVKYSQNINAGTAVVTVSGKGNYKGEVQKNFTINKKAVKITASNVTKTVGAKAFSLGAKADNNGTLKYSLSNTKLATINNGKVTLKKNAVGKTVITVTAEETANYAKATKQITLTVNPKSVTGLKAVSKSKKKITITWKKSSNITGYKIQYSTNKNFKSAKTVKVKSAKTSSKVISKLKSKKKYYVRICAYKTVSKVDYNSSWSKAKTVTVR